MQLLKRNQRLGSPVQKMRGWRRRRTHRCCCRVKCPETKALPLLAGDSSSSVHKLCPQVMSTPAAWRYRTLHLNSNLYGLWLLMFDSRMSAVANCSPSSSVTYVVCEYYDTKCSPAFLIFFFFSSSQCWTQAVDQVKLIKSSNFLFSV